MIQMNEPQVWTLIGVFAAGLFATITFTTQVMWRSINGRFDAFQAEMKTEFASIRAETAAQFDAVNAKFDAMQTRIEHLDRDIQAISRRVFPE